MVATSGQPAAHRSSAGREEMITPTYADLSITLDTATFSGDLSLVQLGRLQLSRVASCPARHRRPEAHIAASPSDDLLLSLKNAAFSITEQDGRRPLPGPGDIVIYDYRLALFVELPGAVQCADPEDPPFRSGL